MKLTQKQIQDNKKNSVFLAGAIVKNSPKLIKNANNLYIYDKPVYKLLIKEDIEQMILDFLIANDITDRWKSSIINEIFKAIRLHSGIGEVKVDSYDNLICFKNCILDIDKLKIVDHSDEYHFTTYVDIEYDPTAKTTKEFMSFLNGIFTLDDGTPDQETVKTACYIGAYLLYPINKIKKMFLFLGDGANGKSLLIDVYKMFYPRECISALSLEVMSDERSFLRRSLINSRLNIATEAKGKAIASEEIKRIISGEDIVIDIKNFKDVTIRPKTKIIIASNSMPYFADTSHGIDRRFYIINFKNMFVDKTEVERVNPKKRIFLAKDYDKLRDGFEAEKSGILNLFIEFLKYLRTHDWVIPQTANSLEIKKEYREATDILGDWLISNYEESEDTEISAKDIYDKYKEYYNQNVSKILNLSTTKLGRRVSEIFRIKSNVIWDPMTQKTQRFYKLQDRKIPY